MSLGKKFKMKIRGKEKGGQLIFKGEKGLQKYIFLVTKSQMIEMHNVYKSEWEFRRDPRDLLKNKVFHTVIYYIKWVTTSWTYSREASAMYIRKDVLIMSVL